MKNKCIWILIPGLFLATNLNAVELAEFAQAVADKIPQKVREGRISVLKFEPARAENFDQLRDDLWSKLVAYLNEKGYRIFDREGLESMRQERSLSKAAAPPLQAAAPVDYVISATIGRVDGQMVAVTTKITEVKTLQIVFFNETLVAAGNPLIHTTGFHKHDGFYFSSNLGLGYQSTDVAEFQGLSNLGLRGSSLMLGLKAGWSLNSSWVIGLGINTMAFGAFGAPAITSTPDIITEEPSQTKQISMIITGPHVTYYWSSNYFATASIATASILYRDSLKQVNTDNGYGLIAGFGREWWISKNWGIGLMVQMSYTRVELRNIDLALTTTQGTLTDRNFVLSTWALTLSVSATYN